MKLADSVHISWDDGITIDGVEFPFYVGDGVEIEPGGSDFTVVSLPLLVRGVVTLVDRGGRRRVVDQELGDVAEYARTLVHAGLLDAFPDLELPPSLVAA